MGFLAALISAFSATAKDVVSKSLSAKVHPDVSTFASFIFALPYYIVVIAIAAACGMEPLIYSGYFLILVLARSITDVFAEGFKMKAFASGDISLVSSFLSLSPLILAIISPLITGDRVTRYDLLALVLIVLGSVMFLRRDKSTGGVFQLKAVIYALLASVAFALNTCFDRLAVASSGPLISGFAVTLMAGVFSVPLALRHRTALGDLSLYRRGFFVRGAWETIFMVSKLFAMTLVEAHVVLGISRVSLILSVLAGRVAFKEGDTGRRMAATALIYAGLIILLVEHF